MIADLLSTAVCYVRVIAARVRSTREGYPIPGVDGGVPRVPPDLVRMGYPPPPARPGMVYPPRPGMGYPPKPGTGYPPWPGMGVPPPDLRWGTPPPQHSEHLQRDGRYASCVHAGGSSCLNNNSGGSKGQGRASPRGQNFFIFMQFSRKNSQIVCWCPLWLGAAWEILDLPLKKLVVFNLH